MFVITGPGDAPFDCFAADGKILQAAFDETFYFVEAEIWLHEIGLVSVKLQEFFLVRGEAEKIIFFGNQFGGAAADLAVGWLRRVAHIEVVVNAVAAFILTFEDGVGRNALGAADQILHGDGVARLGGADEIGVADAKELPEIAENLLVAIYQVGGGDA